MYGTPNIKSWGWGELDSDVSCHQCFKCEDTETLRRMQMPSEEKLTRRIELMSDNHIIEILTKDGNPHYDLDF